MRELCARRELQAFVFVFEACNRIVVEVPEYKFATYFFDLEEPLPVAAQARCPPLSLPSHFSCGMACESAPPSRRQKSAPLGRRKPLFCPCTTPPLSAVTSHAACLVTVAPIIALGKAHHCPWLRRRAAYHSTTLRLPSAHIRMYRIRFYTSSSHPGLIRRLAATVNIPPHACKELHDDLPTAVFLLHGDLPTGLLSFWII
jgi:hypothetical protein